MKVVESEKRVTKHCGYWERQIEAMWDGDLAHEQVELLVDHLTECPSCKGLWKLHRMLEETPAELWELAPARAESVATVESGLNDRDPE